jgi:Tol biopolymer transport system component
MAGRRALALAGSLAPLLAACSLLVSTDGLGGGDPSRADAGSDSPIGVTDAPAGETAPPVDGGLDAAGPCDVTKPFAPMTALASPISSPSNETAGYFSPDRLTLYFGSNRAGAGDLFLSKRATELGGWSQPDGLTVLNSTERDSDPWVSADQLEIYFDSSRPTTFSASNVFYAKRPSVADAFSAPVLVSGVSSNFDEYEPWLPPSHDRLYFSSNRGGANVFELFSSQGSGSTFGPPALIPGLVSSKDQESPFLTADELTIYFSSGRAGGLGKLDIWTASRPNKDAAFGIPQHLPELSSPADDYPTWLSDDGCRMIVQSYASGDSELYYAVRPK